MENPKFINWRIYKRALLKLTEGKTDTKAKQIYIKCIEDSGYMTEKTKEEKQSIPQEDPFAWISQREDTPILEECSICGEQYTQGGICSICSEVYPELFDLPRYGATYTSVPYRSFRPGTSSGSYFEVGDPLYKSHLHVALPPDEKSLLNDYKKIKNVGDVLLINDEVIIDANHLWYNMLMELAGKNIKPHGGLKRGLLALSILYALINSDNYKISLPEILNLIPQATQGDLPQAYKTLRELSLPKYISLEEKSRKTYFYNLCDLSLTQDVRKQFYRIVPQLSDIENINSNAGVAAILWYISNNIKKISVGNITKSGFLTLLILSKNCKVSSGPINKIYKSIMNFYKK